MKKQKTFQQICVEGEYLQAEVTHQDKYFIVFKHDERYFIRVVVTGKFLTADKSHCAFHGVRQLPDNSLAVNLHGEYMIVRPGYGRFVKDPQGVEVKVSSLKFSHDTKRKQGCAIVGTFTNYKKKQSSLLIKPGENHVWRDRKYRWDFAEIHVSKTHATIKPWYAGKYVINLHKSV